MNDTNKKGSLIAVLAIILVVAVIGGVCFGVVNAIGSISDSLKDKLDSIESDTSEGVPQEPITPPDDSSDSGEAPDDGADSGETPDDGADSGETPDDGTDTDEIIEFVYGVDDPSSVEVCLRINNTADKVCSGVGFYKLKPNTSYTFYWQLDENYEDYGFYIPLSKFDGENNYYFRYFDSSAAISTSKAIIANQLSYLVYNTEGITLTTNDEGLANIMVFECDKTVYQEYGSEFWNVLRSLIKSFKAVEVQ